MSLGANTRRLASRAPIAQTTPVGILSHKFAKAPCIFSLPAFPQQQSRCVSSAPPAFIRKSLGFANHHHHHQRTMASSNGPVEGLRLQNPAIFVCDIQEKFRGAIHEFDSMVTTAQKLVSYANALSIPVYTTTQTSAKLGHTVPSLAALLPTPPIDKTRFSMYVPEIAAALPPASHVALVGIESHICITQTALDLRNAGHRVYVVADGVSSCNRAEVGVALDRLRAEDGVTVTTSESWMYECLGDAAHPNFKGLFNIVKASTKDTKQVLEALPPGPKI